jgi:two-component system copper resistance phosphate regulon response regulator CusR
MGTVLFWFSSPSFSRSASAKINTRPCAAHPPPVSLRFAEAMSRAHLLLIEDDQDIADVTKEELETDGHHVTVAGTVMQGLLLAQEHRPDLIITDLGLPDGDGRDVVIRVCQATAVPVIVLTARDDVSEKVALLALGANDYLVKPVSPRELLVRVAVQLRERGTDLLTFGDLAVSLSRRQATWQGADLQLSARELDLLALLIQDPGRIYTRAEMIQSVWQGELPLASNAIEVHLSNLREKFRQRGAAWLLRTVRGMGYALRPSPVRNVSTGEE